jgi:hypothetical protein
MPLQGAGKGPCNLFSFQKLVEISTHSFNMTSIPLWRRAGGCFTEEEVYMRILLVEDDRKIASFVIKG